MKFRKFIRDESGATAFEYGLIAALIAMSAIILMQSLGSELKQSSEAEPVGSDRPLSP